jgi:hypothetical protein
MGTLAGRAARAAVGTLLSLLLGVAAQAAVPQRINYQGHLTNAASQPVTATVTMVFRLYTAPSGGSPIYTETQSVPVANGVYNVAIGTATPLNVPFDVPYYLGVTVGTDAEMTPRQAVLSSPYALRAAAVDAAAALPAAQITGTLTTGQFGDGSVTAAKLASNGCVSGQVLKFNGTAWVCAADATGGTATVFLQSGNAFGATAVLGTTDNNALDVRVANTRAMRYEPNATSPNLIGGSPTNRVTAGVAGASIGGGGTTEAIGCIEFSPCWNRVTDDHGTIAGGRGNQAGNGAGTSADAAYATVGGGYANEAHGAKSTVAGGSINAAAGEYATVPGGYWNLAYGDYSFAAGSRARANEDRTFVWGGSSEVDTESQGVGSFVVYAPGGVRMYAGAPGSGGCTLTNGASGWSCSSDRSLKSGVERVDASDVLDRVATLPIARWSFTAAPGVAHLGPMAQDFHAAFGLGDDPKRLAPMDVQGVALAAIQGLNTKLEAKVAGLAQAMTERDARIAAQQERIAELEERLAQFESVRGDLASLRQALAELQQERPSVTANSMPRSRTTTSDQRK